MPLAWNKGKAGKRGTKYLRFRHTREQWGVCACYWCLTSYGFTLNKAVYDLNKVLYVCVCALLEEAVRCRPLKFLSEHGFIKYIIRPKTKVFLLYVYEDYQRK